MALMRKVNGEWHKVSREYRKIGGQWRQLKAEWRKINGEWRKVFDMPGVQFEEYLQDIDRLYGSYRLTRGTTSMKAEISGYTGGESYVCAIGWMMRDIPVGSAVKVTFKWYKGTYERNDVIMYDSTGVKAVYSSAGEEVTSSVTVRTHTGWVLLAINFFAYSSNPATTTFEITSVEVDGVQVFPAQ